MHNFDWDDVRIFLEIIRSGSLSKAAEQLAINQSTVSRRIGALEQRLGVPLFERMRGASWVLTAAGEDMQRSAEQMNDSANAIARDVLRNNTELRGSVTITCTDAGAQVMTLPVFVKCARRFPQLELSLLVSNDTLDLAAREADIAVRIAESAPPDVVAKRICRVGLALYGTRQWVDAVAAGRRDIPTVGWAGSHPYDDWVAKYFPESPITYRSNSGSAELRMARLGLGVALLGCVLGDTAPDLYRLPGYPLIEAYDLWVLSHVDLRTTARVRMVRDFIVEMTEQYRDLISGYPDEADVRVPPELSQAIGDNFPVS